MCGLIARLGDGDPSAAAAMAAGLDAMEHRGRDDRLLVCRQEGSLRLGFRRLALVSPKHGRQPLSTRDGRVWAVVNGEIYDDDWSRAVLARRGHRFGTGSDAEVLLHTYVEAGLFGLGRLRGEFAFVLWDERSMRLVAGRDRFGVKPLVYAQTPGAVWVASEAKALFAAGLPAAWDGDAVVRSFAHQYLGPGQTLFEGVREVEPGQAVIVDREGRLQLERFTGLPEPCVQSFDPRGAQARVRGRLEDAVKVRLRGDARVGAYLSGGLDSASVVALAARHAPTLPTFGLRFDAEDFDESSEAEATASALGLPFTPVPVSRMDLVRDLEAAVRVAEGLAVNGQLVAKHRLAHAARRGGVQVVLTGEGADEAFLGYPHLRLDAGRGLDAGAERTRGLMLPERGAGSMPGLERRLGFLPTFVRAKAEFGARLSELLEPGLQRPLGTLWDELGAALGPAPLRASPVEVSAWMWTRTALARYIIRTLGDGTEMAATIEGRPPFLDGALFELAWSLPVEQRLDPDGKAVLRAAMAGIVPEPARLRAKHPLVAPAVLGDREARGEGLALLREVAPYVPGVERRRLKAWSDAMERSSEKEQQRWDPVWTTLTSAGLLGRSLGLAAPSSMEREESRA